MRGLFRQGLVIWAMLIGGFLVLTHFTGFERDVRAVATAGVGATKALQGR